LCPCFPVSFFCAPLTILWSFFLVLRRVLLPCTFSSVMTSFFSFFPFWTSSPRPFSVFFRSLCPVSAQTILGFLDPGPLQADCRVMFHFQVFPISTPVVLTVPRTLSDKRGSTISRLIFLIPLSPFWASTTPWCFLSDPVRSSSVCLFLFSSFIRQP